MEQESNSDGTEMSGARTPVMKSCLGWATGGLEIRSARAVCRSCPPEVWKIVLTSTTSHPGSEKKSRLLRLHMGTSPNLSIHSREIDVNIGYMGRGTSRKRAQRIGMACRTHPLLENVRYPRGFLSAERQVRPLFGVQPHQLAQRSPFFASATTSSGRFLHTIAGKYHRVPRG